MRPACAQMEYGTNIQAAKQHLCDTKDRYEGMKDINDIERWTVSPFPVEF